MSSSIDSVTASFAASLALAEGDKALDLSKIGGGPVRRSTQVFLLGKPLTRRPVDTGAFKAHFKRTWVVSRNFQIQERTSGLFLFSFENERDRKKVLKGGVWCFDRAPVWFAPYDGIAPMTAIPIKSILMWVVVTEIPPAYEEPSNFRLIGNLLGGFEDYDREEYTKNRVVKLQVRHDLVKPVLLERKVMLDVGVEPVLKFEFLYLQGRCNKCGLITHAGIPCGEVPRAPAARSLNFGGILPPDKYAFKAGSTTVPVLNVAAPTQVVADSRAVKKKTKAVVRRRGSSSTSPDTLSQEHAVTASVDVQAPLGKDGGVEMSLSPPIVTSKKRERGGGLSPSPKKFKNIFGGKTMTLRPESLGLIEIEDGNETIISFKKKIGRPFGSKNKENTEKVGKKKKHDTMRPTFPVAKAVQLKNSPNSKGKDKI